MPLTGFILQYIYNIYDICLKLWGSSDKFIPKEKMPIGFVMDSRLALYM